MKDVMTIEQDNYLRRSHVTYPVRSILKIYLIVLTIPLAVVAGVYLLSEPTVEIVNGSPAYVSTLDRSTDRGASQRTGWFGEGFIGLVRLVPTRSEPETKLPRETCSFQHESGLSIPSSPIFDQELLMSRLEDDSTVGRDIIFYTISHEREL